jgi:hypothetical protein
MFYVKYQFFVQCAIFKETDEVHSEVLVQRLKWSNTNQTWISNVDPQYQT